MPDWIRQVDNIRCFGFKFGVIVKEEQWSWPGKRHQSV
jgi:hypothetical protein